MPSVIHPSLRPWLEIAWELGEVATKRLDTAMRPRRRGSYQTRRPGADTPFWNALAAHMREELKPLGAKVRLARYLDIPKQRLNDFLTGRSRQPDAELTLQMLHWLAEKRGGRDLSL